MSIELQNAYALSRSEYRSGCHSKRIHELQLAGKYILGCTGEVHCRFTDAVIASEDRIDSVHDTYAAAVEANGGEPDDGYMWIAEPIEPEPMVLVPRDTGEECPF